MYCKGNNRSIISSRNYYFKIFIFVLAAFLFLSLVIWKTNDFYGYAEVVEEDHHFDQRVGYYEKFYNNIKQYLTIDDHCDNRDSSAMSGDDALDLEMSRKHFLSKEKDRRDAVTEKIAKAALGDIQTSLVPQIQCPHPVRVGQVGDGGKWVCHPWRAIGGANQTCAVFSLGVAQDVSFEQDLYEITNKSCKIFSFDTKPPDNVNELFARFNGTFKAWTISGETNVEKGQYSLMDAVRMLGYETIDFLKVDIEGSEYKLIENFFDTQMIKNGSVCQLFIELHFRSVKQWADLILSLEKSGFLMFFKEANSYWLTGHEYSFIHEKCLKRFNVPNRVLFRLTENH